MSPSARLLALAVAASVAAACSDTGLDPSPTPADDAALNRITTGAITGPNFAFGGLSCDRSSPIGAFGLTHLPSGAAQLALTPAGGLRVAGLGPSGSDGMCTRLPGATRVSVSLSGNQPGGFGRMRPNEGFRILFAGPDGWRQTCGVLGASNGGMAVGCHNAAVSGWVVELVENGQVVRTATVDGPRVAATVPGFVLRDFEWDLDHGGAFGVEGVFEGLVLKGLMIIPIVDAVSPLPTGLSGMATTMATPFPDREYHLTGNDGVQTGGLEFEI